MIQPLIASVWDAPTWIGPVVVAVTIVLSAVLAAQAAVFRQAAARHAVLLAGLLTIGLSPLIFLATDFSGVTPALRFSTPFLRPASTAPSGGSPQIPASNVGGFSPALDSCVDWLWRIWIVGSLFTLARVAHGVIVSRRLRRVPSCGECKSRPMLTSRLTDILGRPAPPILYVSDIRMPMTVGFIRPIVVLPAGLAERLGEARLLHVLVHECAHALRRDPLVGLYQRLLAALFWFHPLIHLTNRLLDEAREELCDNWALRAASPADYTRTLLLVAQTVGDPPHHLLVASFFNSVPRLEKRVAGLLVPGRNAMTHVKGWKSLAIAVGFISGGYVLTAWAASTSRSAGHDLSHRVEFSVGAQQFNEGDAINIDEIIGTADRFEAGNVYIIKGTYRLTSRNSAALTAYVTIDGDKVKELRVPTQRTQTMAVEQGEGQFSLIYYMWQDGWPHLSFYPNDGGSWIGTVYFGTGDTVLKRGWWEK